MKRQANRTKLQYFETDASRLAKLTDPQFYQMDLSAVVAEAAEADPDLFREDGALLPSWSKFAADPIRAKGFFVNMLQSMFEAKGGHDEVNIDLQIRRRSKEPAVRVGMMFLSGSITNENMEHVTAIAKQALSSTLVVTVTGEHTTNAEAERTVKIAVEKAERDQISQVLVLSAGMAQRSFSIGEITEVYLAYDNGDAGATIQKMSRALTPWRYDLNKIARIVSLSFDANRDDKFDAIVLEAAKNYTNNPTNSTTDISEALAMVLRTLDIFKCGVDGAEQLSRDAYLADILTRNSIDRVIGKVAHIEELSEIELQAIAEGNANLLRLEEQNRAPKGKTRATPRARGGAAPKDMTQKQYEKLVMKVREVLATIAQNIDIIRYQGGDTLEEAFEIIDSDEDLHEAIEDNFGLPYDMIRILFERGILNADLLNLKFASQ